MFRRAALIACVLLFSAITSQVAQAQYPYGGDVAAWNGWGYGGWGYLGTRVGFQPQPPYYAVHPPVYYSAKIIRRPYGYSPFAWPANYPPFGTEMIESRFSAVSDPAIFKNPYAEPAAGGQLPKPRNASGDQSSVQPLLIINPYVAQKAVASRN